MTGASAMGASPCAPILVVRRSYAISRPMPAAASIRDYRPEDLDTLIELFAGSVRLIASRDYTAAQIEAWAPAAVNRSRWKERLERRPTFVAELEGEVAVFSDLEPDGCIDMMFVHCDHQGKGVARALLEHIHLRARRQGLKQLFTEASITARPLFERHGFEVIEAQDAEMRGQTFRNFQMAKAL